MLAAINVYHPICGQGAPRSVPQLLSPAVRKVAKQQKLAYRPGNEARQTV